MTPCKWNADKADYLTLDGEPCRHDDYGDPTRHCTAKRSCSHHVGPRELTCGRCLGDVRNDVRAIVELAALMPYEALTGGVNSEAANMAGPGADYRVFEARRSIARAWIYDNIRLPARDWCDDLDCQRRHFKTSKDKDRWHKRGLENALQDLLADDDEWHPYGVLTRWHLMLAEDYAHPLPDRMSTSDSAAYLDRHLGKVAQDDEQDFPLLRREMRTCRQHLEAVLHNSRASEKGAPCPVCEHPQRLRREYAHWVDQGEDKGWKLSYRTTPDLYDEAAVADRWVCPTDRKHWWAENDYRKWIETRKVG